MPRAVTFALLSATAAEHYGKPPCLDDETELSSDRTAICAASCGGTAGDCPADMAGGLDPQFLVSCDTSVDPAHPDGLCVFHCSEDADCGGEAKCELDGPSKNGYCTFAARPHWQEYDGKNCYLDHGSTGDIDTEPLDGVVGSDACKAACAELDACQAITVSADGKCQRRGFVDISGCDDDPNYDTYTIVAPTPPPTPPAPTPPAPTPPTPSPSPGANPTHYGPPSGCKEDETVITVSKGSICAPPAPSGMFATCPRDTPKGSSMMTQKPQKAQSYMGLGNVCVMGCYSMSASGYCARGQVCQTFGMMSMMQMGLCVYPDAEALV